MEAAREMGIDRLVPSPTDARLDMMIQGVVGMISTLGFGTSSGGDDA